MEAAVNSTAARLSSPAMIPMIAAVLEDAVDQLAVLGGIAPPSSARHLMGVKEVIGEEIADIVRAQRSLEAEYDRLLRERAHLQRQVGVSAELQANKAALTHVAESLKQSTKNLARNLTANPGAIENIGKLQRDRRFAQDLLSNAYTEIISSESLSNFAEAVQDEIKRKIQFQQMISSEEQSRKDIALLKQQIRAIKEETESDVFQKDETIARLKDQLQSAKANWQIEYKYIRKEASMRIDTSNKRANLTTKDLNDQAATLQQSIDQESKANFETEQFLRDKCAELADKLDVWMTKYEQDNEDKQRELDMLKQERAKDLARLQELSEIYGENEKVVLLEREAKRRVREAAEQTIKELTAAIRIQAWWRGLLVKHQLGPHRQKKTKSSAKKGKGKGKK